MHCGVRIENVLRKLLLQRIQNILVLDMRSQTPPWRTPNAVLAVQHDIQRIKGMATRRHTNANAVVEALRLVMGGAILTLIEFKLDLTQVVQFGDVLPLNLGLDATFEDAVE